MPGMDKVLRGILRYRATERNEMVHQFQAVKNNPEPTAVFFSCMDSRILASRFTMTNVGDMFIVRNAGNLIPHSRYYISNHITPEPAALDLGCVRGNIRHVVVCGHSDCKAMNLLYSLHHDGDHACTIKHGALSDDECSLTPQDTPLEKWLKRHGRDSINKFNLLAEENKFTGPLIFQGETDKHTFEAYIDPDDNFEIADKLSQVNCLQQLQNIASYQFLKDRLVSNRIRLHAMWFDIYTGNVFMFSRKERRFIEITPESHQKLLYDSENY